MGSSTLARGNIDAEKIFSISITPSSVAANALTIQFGNFTGGALTPVAGSYPVLWCNPENLPLDSNAL